jgi:hypothetical protein
MKATSRDKPVEFGDHDRAFTAAGLSEGGKLRPPLERVGDPCRFPPRRARRHREAFHLRETSDGGALHLDIEAGLALACGRKTFLRRLLQIHLVIPRMRCGSKANFFVKEGQGAKRYIFDVEASAQIENGATPLLGGAWRPISRPAYHLGRIVDLKLPFGTLATGIAVLA